MEEEININGVVKETSGYKNDYYTNKIKKHIDFVSGMFFGILLTIVSAPLINSNLLLALVIYFSLIGCFLMIKRRYIAKGMAWFIAILLFGYMFMIFSTLSNGCNIV